MAAKYQLITELYQRTGKTVTRNPQAWQNFLSSACRNYKCRFDEQDALGDINRFIVYDVLHDGGERDG